MKSDIYNRLCGILPKERLFSDEPLKKYTSFKIGGPADFLAIPQNSDELKQLFSASEELGIPCYVIGNGSNLLVSDAGFRGIIILIKDIKAVPVFEQAGDKTRVRAAAGCPLSRLAFAVADKGLKGFEFAAGIPGTLGGAVVMNAGAYGGEIKQSIISATVMDKSGQVKRLLADELCLGYRSSIIQKEGYTVLDAEFEFEAGNAEDIRSTINELNEQRRQKQPLESPSAGSTFKRPEGNFAGKLIMEAGLRGFSVGDAAVSEKHCGFVINKGQATAADVCELIKQIIDRVYTNSGIILEPEIKFLGDMGNVVFRRC